MTQTDDPFPAKSMFVFTSAALLGLILLSSCTFGPPAAPKENQVTDPLDKAVAPTDAQGRDLFTPHPSMDTGPMEIQVGDVLRVQLVGENIQQGGWGGEFRVPPDGRLNFMYAGSVNVVDKTREQVQTTLVNRLKPDYYRDPSISINFVELSQIEVRAMGAIGQSQLMTLSRDATLMDALVTAGDLTRHSQRLKMYLFRYDQGDTAIYFSNYEKYVAGDFRQDLRLRDGDVLYVRANFWPHFDTLKDVLDTIGFAATSADRIRDLGEAN